MEMLAQREAFPAVSLMEYSFAKSRIPQIINKKAAGSGKISIPHT